MKSKKDSYLYRQLFCVIVASLICLTKTKASTIPEISEKKSELKSFLVDKSLAIQDPEACLFSKRQISMIGRSDEKKSVSNKTIQLRFSDEREETELLENLVGEQNIISGGIHELVGSKVVLNSLVGDSACFLSADMRTLDLRMYKYINPEQSFTQFDERHWQVISMGTHCGASSYRLQYVLAPGFSKILHSLACIERNGIVNLGLMAHQKDPKERADMEWLIFGNNKRNGVFLKNLKYDLYLQGSSDNKISLTSCPTDQGLRWRIGPVDDYSKTIVLLKGVNSNFTAKEKADDDYVDLGLIDCASQTVLKKNYRAEYSQYLSIDIKMNSLEFNNLIAQPTRYPISPITWESLTNSDSTLFLLNAMARPYQKSSVTMTATPVQQETGGYPPVGIYPANRKNSSGQFWVAIPVESGSDRYNMYLRDSVNGTLKTKDELPLTLSLTPDNQIILAPQDLFTKELKYANSIPLQVTPQTPQLLEPDYIQTLEKSLVSLVLPGSSLLPTHPSYAGAYNMIEISDQESILANAGYPFTKSQRAAYGAALLITSYAQKLNAQNYPLSVVKSASPACTISWYSNGNNADYSVYILMMYGASPNKNIRAYDPMNRSVPVYSTDPQDNQNGIQSFPKVGTWNPAFV